MKVVEDISSTLCVTHMNRERADSYDERLTKALSNSSRDMEVMKAHFRLSLVYDHISENCCSLPPVDKVKEMVNKAEEMVNKVEEMVNKVEEMVNKVEEIEAKVKEFIHFKINDETMIKSTHLAQSDRSSWSRYGLENEWTELFEKAVLDDKSKIGKKELEPNMILDHFRIIRMYIAMIRGDDRALDFGDCEGGGLTLTPMTGLYHYAQERAKRMEYDGRFYVNDISKDGRKIEK